MPRKEPYDVLDVSHSQMEDEIDMNTLPSIHLLPLQLAVILR